jgi:hypothetical protein
MLIKLLYRDDIRRYNASTVDVVKHIAEKLISLGRACFVGEPFDNKKKGFGFPPIDKVIWSPPENKVLASLTVKSERKPGVNESLFPKSIIGGAS